MSGHVSSRSGPQLLGVSQQSGNVVPNSVAAGGGAPPAAFGADTDLLRARSYMQEKITDTFYYVPVEALVLHHTNMVVSYNMWHIIKGHLIDLRKWKTDERMIFKVTKYADRVELGHERQISVVSETEEAVAIDLALLLLRCFVKATLHFLEASSRAVSAFGGMKKKKIFHGFRELRE
ncbi:hypothetical protein NL676_009998 [Syzygium grande]|nr:hypothetical protein NL676_009998 [Syzygium grande]